MEGDTLMASSAPRIVLYLDREALQIYSPAFSGVLTLPFPSDVLLHGDVLNGEKLESVISAFIMTNKLSEAKVIVVLSLNIYFEKTILFPNTVQEQKPSPTGQQQQIPVKENLSSVEKAKKIQEQIQFQEEETKKFLDSVPFDTITSKTYKVANGFRILAANRDYYEQVQNAFTKHKFIFESVLPSTLFGQLASFTNGLTVENGKVVLIKADSMRAENLFLEHNRLDIKEREENPDENAPNIETVAKTNKKRLIVMIIFLIALLAFTVYFYMQTFSSPPPKKKIKQKIPVTTISPTVIPTVITPSATNSALLDTRKEIVTIEIVSPTNASDSARARILLANLEKLGYTNVSLVTRAVSNTRTLIVTSPIMEKEIQDEILRETQVISPITAIQQSEEAGDNIIITLKKS